MIQGAEDGGNLPFTPEVGPKKEAGSGLLLAVEKLRAARASLRYEDRAHQAELELPLWNLEIGGDASTLNHRLHLETADVGSLALEGSRTAVNRVLIAMDAGRNGASVEEPRLAAALALRGLPTPDSQRLQLWNGVPEYVSPLFSNIRDQIAYLGNRLTAEESRI